MFRDVHTASPVAQSGRGLGAPRADGWAIPVHPTVETYQRQNLMN